MPKKEPNLTSPYYQPESSVSLFKLRLIQHINLMRMPTVQDDHGKCSRECHIVERNHTLEAIKHFVTNVEGVEK